MLAVQEEENTLRYTQMSVVGNDCLSGIHTTAATARHGKEKTWKITSVIVNYIRVPIKRNSEYIHVLPKFVAHKGMVVRASQSEIMLCAVMLN